MKRLIALAVLAFSAGGAWAAAGPVGDAEAGKAKTTACVACHGTDGNSASGEFPGIAGQGQRYLLKQLKEIQCGARSAEEQAASRCVARPVPLMAGMLNSFNDQDLADIAAFYAGQKASLSGAADSTEAPLALGERIYRAGIREKGVAACAACHSPTGVGNAPAAFPRLGGQHAKYTVAQMKAFRRASEFSDDELRDLRSKGENPDAGRRNDGADEATSVMRAVAAKLSDREIEAVANYIAGLH